MCTYTNAHAQDAYVYKLIRKINKKKELIIQKVKVKEN
jgi:hypothetical protein